MGSAKDTKHPRTPMQNDLPVRELMPSLSTSSLTSFPSSAGIESVDKTHEKVEEKRMIRLSPSDSPAKKVSPAAVSDNIDIPVRALS